MAAAAGSEDGGAATTTVWPGGEQLLLLSAEGVGRSAVPSSPEDPAPRLLHYGLTLSVPDPQPPHLDTATMRKAGDWVLPYDGPGSHLCAWDDLGSCHCRRHRRQGKGHGCASPSPGGASATETAVHVIVVVVLALADRLSGADSSFDLNVGKWNGIFYQFDAHWDGATGDQRASVRQYVRGGRPHQPHAIVVYQACFVRDYICRRG